MPSTCAGIDLPFRMSSRQRNDLFLSRDICTPRNGSGKWSSAAVFSPAAWRKFSAIFRSLEGSVDPVSRPHDAPTSIISCGCSASAHAAHPFARAAAGSCALRLDAYCPGVNATSSMRQKTPVGVSPAAPRNPSHGARKIRLIIVKGFALFAFHRAIHPAKFLRHRRQTRRPTGKAPFAVSRIILTARRLLPARYGIRRAACGDSPAAF